MDHAFQIIAAIVPRRRDLAFVAFARLQPEHFIQSVQRNIFVLLSRYMELTGEIITSAALEDLLNRQGVDPAKVLVYLETFNAIAAADVQDHEFRYAVEAIQDLRAHQLTGEAITNSMEIMERGLEVDRVFQKGHTEARTYLYSELAKIDRLSGAASQAPEGDIRQDRQEVMKEYADRKAGKLDTGVFCGIPSIDNNTLGFQNGELDIIAAFTAQGKMQPLDAKILTPLGWKRMGELCVGDAVINSAGVSSKVTGVFPKGLLPIYKVSMSDGSSTEAGAEHLWKFQDNSQRNHKQRRGRWSIGTTADIKRMLESAGKAGAERQDFYIPLVAPVEFGGTALEDLPVHPYLLGCLIGDGCLKYSTPEFTTADSEVFQSFRQLLPSDCLIKHTDRYDYRITGLGQTTRTINPLVKRLQTLGLQGKGSESKFIPSSYAMASIEARIALLQGLMDTDGSVGAGGQNLEFTSCSKQLAEDVRALVQSLGGYSRISAKTTSYEYMGEKKVGQLAYRQNLALPAEYALFKPLVPFRLERKIQRLVPRKRPISRNIVSVELVGEKPCQCISVNAADGLYVTDDFIVTHNTTFVSQLAWQACLDGRNVYFVTSETIRAQVRRKILARHSRQPQFGLPEGINSADLKAARLAPDLEVKFQEVLDDFTNNPTYGKLYLAQIPRGGTLGLVESRLNRAQQNWHVDLVIIDYLALIKPDRHRGSQREEFNDVIRDTKVLAATFDDGRGVPIVSPWQMSQAAWKEAVRNGEYSLASLAETSEVEKSGDAIISLLQLPDSPSELKGQFLKLRDGDRHNPFTLEVDFRTAYLGMKIASTAISGLLDDDD